MRLRTASTLKGVPKLPGDKSISHRAALISAISSGETRIENYSMSADCASTLQCLKDLGVAIERQDNDVVITGLGRSGLRRPKNVLDCGNSGTTMRLLAGILAGQGFDATLTGDGSLRSRPMERITVPLTEMGASINTTDGKAPLTIRGRSPLQAIEFRPRIASAQIKSAVLLAGIYADGITTVIEDIPTRDHTERMLETFGIEVRRENSVGERISINGGQPVSPGVLNVPADISAGSFFMIGAACLPDSDIVLEGVGMNPTRTAVIDVLKELGVEIEIITSGVQCNEPVATVRIRGGLRSPVESDPYKLDRSIIPNLIDEIPILAVLGTQSPNGLEVRGAHELRNKESDRISAIVQNLALMGADITEFDDGFRVKPSRLNGARIDSYGDHRIAMAFAIAGLLADGETEILEAQSADVSFPGFFQTLESVVRY